MSDNVRTILTEILVSIWISTGVAAHFATAVLFLQIVFYCLSCISVLFIVTINYDKFMKRISKTPWFNVIKNIFQK